MFLRGSKLSLPLGIVFLFGTLLGSFLNVCIYRLPRKQSVVWPGSHCSTCKKPIRPWQNIPILSYLLLRGRCGQCNATIPITYPLVELITGVLLVWIWQQHGMSWSFVHYSLLVLLLVPISFIDLDTQLILNVLTFPGMVLGLAMSVLAVDISFGQAAAGLLLGGGSLYAIGLVGDLLFKQESMGGGDIKLGAMIGTFLGPQVLIALFLAFFLALPIIAIGMGTNRLHLGSKLPFGPFIALGTVVIICFGPALYSQYFRLVGQF